MSKVFVLDTNKEPLNPVHPGRARLLLNQGKAAVYRRYPFTLILKRAVEQPTLHPLHVKVDPGSIVTGIALLNDASGQVVWAAELRHRGEQIKCGLNTRRAVRRSRRQRKTRYRQPRFQNRRKREGTLPRSTGGSNRVSNLVAACTACNQRKSNQQVGEFLKDGPARLARILAHLKAPLTHAAAVNATRWALYERLKALGLPVECGSGGLTKYNRLRRGLPKTHWCDAACVGRSTPERLTVTGVRPLQIRAIGHGSRQMCNVDRFGFPCSKPKGAKRVRGFQTGDLVRAVVTRGSKAGTYVGQVAVRTCGSFNITTARGRVTDIHHRFCTLIARSDGYTYQQSRETALPLSA
jgi:hypothetical protein